MRGYYSPQQQSFPDAVPVELSDKLTVNNIINHITDGFQTPYGEKNFATEPTKYKKNLIRKKVGFKMTQHFLVIFCH